MAEEFDIAFLGNIPLVQSIREGGDSGFPAMVGEDLVTQNAFREFAGNAVRSIAIRNANLESSKVVEVLA